MRLLVIHQNFPGQFRHLIPEWVREPGWEVRGLGRDTAPGLPGIDGLKRYRLERPGRDLAPYSADGKKGRPPLPIEIMLRGHFMQQWFTLTDPAIEEALHEMRLPREFAGLTWDSRIPDERTILHFRDLLEKHKLAEQTLDTVNAVLLGKCLMLKAGTVVDATLIAAPSSTKNQNGELDPETKQSNKGNKWRFGMKAHIGVDAESGALHTLRGTSGNVKTVVEAHALLHGVDKVVFAASGYRAPHKRPYAKLGVTGCAAMISSSRKPHEKTSWIGTMVHQIEHLKASVLAKGEHPLRVTKRQFGYVKVRCRGLVKNTAQLNTLFVLSNLWMARRQLMALQTGVHPMNAKAACKRA